MRRTLSLFHSAYCQRYHKLLWLHFSQALSLDIKSGLIGLGFFFVLCFQYFNYVASLSVGLPFFFMYITISNYMHHYSLYVMCLFSQVALKIFSIFLNLHSLTIILLGVALFTFILALILRVFWDSWIFKFKFFTNWGKFLDIMFSNIPSSQFYLFLFFLEL